MHPALIWGAVAVGSALYRAWRSKQQSPSPSPKPDMQGVAWEGEMLMPVPLDDLRSWTARLLCEAANCRLLSSADMTDIFVRGNVGINAVRVALNLMWRDVPVTITARYSISEKRTKLALEIAALPLVTFDAASTNSFYDLAKNEFQSLFEALKMLGQSTADRSSQVNGSSHADASTHDAPDDEDLRSLGLKPGASWPQIQAAYRECCRKYHPDRLNGKNVEPHLVELAVQRFKEITAAYQRLKERMSA